MQTLHVPPWIEPVSPEEEQRIIERVRDDSQLGERFDELPAAFTVDFSRAHVFRSHDSTVVALPPETTSNRTVSAAIRINDGTRATLQTTESRNDAGQPATIDFRYESTSGGFSTTLQLEWRDRKQLKSITATKGGEEVDRPQHSCDLCMEVLDVIVATGCGVGSAVICAALTTQTLSARVYCPAIASAVCHVVTTVGSRTVSPAVCKNI